MAKTRGTWTVYRFKRWLGEKETGGVFDGGGWYLSAQYARAQYYSYKKLIKKTPKFDIMMSDSVFSKSAVFYGTFSTTNNFVRQNKTLFLNRRFFWSTQLAILGEKPDYPVYLAKTIKTARLKVTPGGLAGLVSFFSFLTLENYSKNGCLVT